MLLYKKEKEIPVEVSEDSIALENYRYLGFTFETDLEYPENPVSNEKPEFAKEIKFKLKLENKSNNKIMEIPCFVRLNNIKQFYNKRKKNDYISFLEVKLSNVEIKEGKMLAEGSADLVWNSY